jgi:phosphoesterase RecJ-like protein
VISSESYQLFQRLCGEAQSFVLSTHINPDGDALGSQFSLARFLLARGKQVRIINRDPTPDSLGFIVDPSISLECYDAGRHDAVLRGTDRVVLVDNSAPDRLGRMEPVMRSVAERVLCIDHHPMRDAPWAETIVDEESCATAAMIFELVTAAGWKPDALAATAIYVGLVTDTGFFRFDSTNARAHHVAAELLRIGVRSARTYQELYERHSVAFTRLLGHTLSGFKVSADGALAWVAIPLDLVRRLQAENEDTSEIATALLAVGGVSVVALFRELPRDQVKVSLRSKGNLNVHRLATEFGGGGHRNASGIVMSGTLDHVEATITDRALALLSVEDSNPPA